MKKEFKHLSYEERVVIERLKNKGNSIRKISRILNRSPNTISYELKKNKVSNEYIAIKTKHKAHYRRYLCKKGCMKVSINKEIRDFVETYIKLKLSPERISGYLNRDNVLVNSKAIYNIMLLGHGLKTQQIRLWGWSYNMCPSSVSEFYPPYPVRVPKECL